MDREVNSRLTSLQSDIKNQALTKRLMNKQNRRKTIGFSLLAANILLLAIVAGFVLQKPTTTGTTVSNAILATKSEATANPLDTLSSADIALNVARVANLPEQVAVANLADSINDQLTVTPADDIVVDPC